jgi:hypothetical protein
MPGMMLDCAMPLWLDCDGEGWLAVPVWSGLSWA